MKKYSIVILSVCIALGAIASPTVWRTIAIAALGSVTTKYIQSLARMPMDPEMGGDVSFACGVLILQEWGEPVYRSVLTNPELAHRDVLGPYLDTRDSASRAIRKLSEMRSDLEPEVRKEILARYENASMVRAPSNLDFNNFSDHVGSYFSNLSTCTTEAFIQAVNSNLQPLDFDEIHAASVDDAIVGKASSVSVVIGGLGDGNISGIVSSAKIIDVPVRDKSQAFQGEGSYRDWLSTIYTIN